MDEKAVHKDKPLQLGRVVGECMWQATNGQPLHPSTLGTKLHALAHCNSSPRRGKGRAPRISTSSAIAERRWG